MKKFWDVLKRVVYIILCVLSYVWQFPQHFLAIIFLIIYRKSVTTIINYKSSIVFIMSDFVSAGVSLGIFIFLKNKTITNDIQVIKHEYGHSIQSIILGWLYLIIIGIPSAINYIISGKNKDYHKNYYKKYPEKWADYLGNVRRG